MCSHLLTFCFGLFRDKKTEKEYFFPDKSDMPSPSIETTCSPQTQYQCDSKQCNSYQCNSYQCNPPQSISCVDKKITFTRMNDPTITNLKFMLPCDIEELSLIHCKIPKITETFPNSLKVIKITYSGVRDFSTSKLPDDLAEIDLSFNKLEEIPHSIYDAFIKNPAMKVNLKNNDLWFAMYSDLQPSMISPQTVNELVKAHRMNYLSTVKLNYAVRILREKNFDKDAKYLSQKIKEQLSNRVKDGGCTWDNKENVHLSSVQDNVKDAIDRINRITTPPLSSSILDIITDTKLREYVATDLSISPEYANITKKIYEIAVMYCIDSKIIVDELRDGMNTCLTGKISRMINVLNGFVPGIGVGISKNEEVANSILVIRNRNTIVYGTDTERYINETYPAVLQILEDACIPEEEQNVWTEYI